MTPFPLVPVEGALARPRIAPLDGVPPFGREWTFRGVSGSRPGKDCLATLTTSCIDVDAPHRACRWQPLPTLRPSPARALVVPANTPRQHPARAVGRAPDRRALHVLCLSIGALGIIGWLIAAHEPFPGFAPASALQTASVMQEQATQATGVVPVATATPVAPTADLVPHTATPPAATPSASPPAMRAAAPEPAPGRAGATSNAQRVATASPPSAHHPPGSGSTTTRSRTHSAPRLAARPPAAHLASRPPAHERPDRLAHPSATHDPLDDPLTLIAMANALRADRPAPAANAPAAGFDWTAQLSHRRVTDVPDAFAR